jgi:predicted Zn-dependent peptidase
MSSRLFQEVREKRGLCYAIYAFASGLTDSGLFAVHAAGAPDRAHELFAVIRDELVRAAENGFREDEIARVKAQLKMGLLTGLESSSARAEQLARQILIHGRPLSAQELIEKVERVEAADLQVLVERLLSSPPSLATVGPILHVARFDAVAEKFAIPPSKAA